MDAKLVDLDRHIDSCGPSAGRPTDGDVFATGDWLEPGGDRGQGGRVDSIVVEGDTLMITRTDGSEVSSRKEPVVSVTEVLRNYGVEPETLSKMALEVPGPSA